VIDVKVKGERFERELVNMFWDEGFAATRIPASGSMSYPSPDIIAGNGKRYLAIEVKMRSNLPVYIPKQDIDNLIRFSERFGAEPYVAIKIKKMGWRFFKVDQLKETRGGFKVDESNFYSGFDFKGLIGLKQLKLIDYSHNE